MESKCGRASQNFACLFESGILDSFRPYVGAQIKAEMILLEQGAGHGDGTPHVASSLAILIFPFLPLPESPGL